MRRRLAGAVLILALAMGACTGQDTAGEPVRAPTTSDAASMPPLARIELGFTGAPPTTPGSHDLQVTTVEEDGRSTTRDVTVHVPEGEGPFPVILALHPFGSSGPRFERMTGIGTAGAARGAVVILPDAIGPAWNASLTCCQPAISERHPDAAFVIALLDVLAAGLPIDRTRVTATGFSNGGYLAYRLACARADLVSRVAVVAASMDLPCEPSQPVSVLHLHGTDDPVIPMIDDRAPFTPGAESRGARHIVDFWGRRGGCDIPPATDLTASVTFGACDAGVEVQLVSVTGLAHRWPTTPDATSLAVAFLLDD